MTSPRTVLFIGLNPSIADETRDDPTIRRERGFAKTWECTGCDAFLKIGNTAAFRLDRKHRFVLWRPEFTKVNLFSLISTDPKGLDTDPEPSSIENGVYTLAMIKAHDLIICAWGANKHAAERAPTVLQMIRDAGKVPHAIRITKSGAPEHPLYLPGGLTPVPYSGERYK